MAPVCSHLDQVLVRQLPAHVAGCEECLKTGGRWVHLRLCLTCNTVGCCDDSPNRHASRHSHAAGHPVIRTVEPGEEWCWCFEDERAFVIDFVPER